MNKGELTKAKIIAKASELFMKQGFEETTFSQIAKQVKITQPALYAYFDNKMDILKNAALFSAKQGAEIIEKSINQNSRAEEKFYQYIRANLEFFHQNRVHGHNLVSMYYFAGTSKSVKETFLAVQNIGIARINNFLTLLEYESKIPVIDKALIASQIHSLLVGEIYKQFYLPTELSPTERSDQIWLSLKKWIPNIWHI